jgi:hypothetical protein
VPAGPGGIETIQVAETCRAHGIDCTDLRAFVRLANGKTVYARRKGIHLEPGFPWPQDARQ